MADLRITLALEEAARELKVPCKTGISVSTDSFWPGQERYDSFSGYVRRNLQGSLAEYRALGCTNFEMENATLFTLTSVLGLAAGSICGVVAKRTESEAVAPDTSVLRVRAMRCTETVAGEPGVTRTTAPESRKSSTCMPTSLAAAADRSRRCRRCDGGNGVARV